MVCTDAKSVCFWCSWIAHVSCCSYMHLKISIKQSFVCGTGRINTLPLGFGWPKQSGPPYWLSHSAHVPTDISQRAAKQCSWNVLTSITLQTVEKLTEWRNYCIGNHRLSKEIKQVMWLVYRALVFMCTVLSALVLALFPTFWQADLPLFSFYQLILCFALSRSPVSVFITSFLTPSSNE